MGALNSPDNQPSLKDQTKEAFAKDQEQAKKHLGIES
jgi:hypothetical protein